VDSKEYQRGWEWHLEWGLRSNQTRCWILNRVWFGNQVLADKCSFNQLCFACEQRNNAGPPRPALTSICAGLSIRCAHGFDDNTVMICKSIWGFHSINSVSELNRVPHTLVLWTVMETPCFGSCNVPYLVNVSFHIWCFYKVKCKLRKNVLTVTFWGCFGKVVQIKDYTMLHNNKGGTLSKQRSQNVLRKSLRPEMTECIL